MGKITVITGHYGSGKSTFAANLAVSRAAKGERITVVDMDTVNPYYRTADLKEVFRENGVGLAAPMYAGTNLDVPILNFDIPALFAEKGSLVIDLGGDDAGAYPLGKFRSFLACRREETQMLCVVNFFRFLTSSEEDALENLREIENACGVKVTGIVNNSNLGFETDAAVIEKGREKAEKLSEISGIPLLWNTVPELPGCKGFTGEEYFPVKIYIRNFRD